MTSTQRWLLAMMALLLLSCQSTPPPVYYRLDATAATASGEPGPSIGVMPVAAPEYLSRSNLVRDSRGSAVAVDGGEKWVEPLDAAIARVVTLNLSRMLPTNDIRPYPWNSRQAPDITIRIKVQDLRSVPGEATLVAETVLTHRDGAFASELISLQTPLSDSLQGSDIASAYNQLLEDFSRQMAASIHRLPAVSPDPAS